MNKSNIIDISKSSLVSLKAEVLKKREEIHAAKLQNQNRTLNKPKKQPETKEKHAEEPKEKDSEEEQMLRKARDILAQKAKLYDKLTKGSNLNCDEIEYKKRMLVHFDRKEKHKSRIADLPDNIDEPDDVDKYPESEEEERHFSDEYDAPTSPGNEWVEYTDCLGRTRKCLRNDLEAIKARDKDLSKTLDPERKKLLETQGFIKESKDEDLKAANTEDFNEQSELLSNDMRREILRQQWEKEEESLRNKSDVHYQDLLFNEARSHGVGYYNFSKDEEERIKQQQELKYLRKETEMKQEASKNQKEQREKLMASRLKAARNRKRARMGLPPEEDEPESSLEMPKIDLEEEKRKKEEEEKRKKDEEIEILRDEKRKKEIRPWDFGKEGVQSVARSHRELTQEEWNDKKRSERPQEFAPPEAYSKSSSKPKREFKSSTMVQPRETPDKPFYFSTKKPTAIKDFNPAVPPPGYSLNKHKDRIEKRSVNPYKPKNYVPSQEPVPIVNECVDFDNETGESSSESEAEEQVIKRKGTEIPPPATFEYYGPSDSKKTKTSNNKGNFEDSITAGLKFLRDQAEKKHIANEKRVIYEH